MNLFKKSNSFKQKVCLFIKEAVLIKKHQHLIEWFNSAQVQINAFESYFQLIFIL